MTNQNLTNKGEIRPENEQKSLVTYGKSIIRPEDTHLKPIQNLMAYMQQGGWRKEIEAIRRESNPTLQREMKQRLPWFVYGVIEGRREDANVRQMNGAIFDFDHLADIPGFKAEARKSVPWARWIFRSPIGGVKVVIPFSRPVTERREYARVWNHLRRELLAQTGFEADNTPDWARACFVSWDGDAIGIDGAAEFDVDSAEDDDTPPPFAPQVRDMGVQAKELDSGLRRNDNHSGSGVSGSGSGVQAKDWIPGQAGNDNGVGSGVSGARPGVSVAADPTELQARSAVEYLAQRVIDRRDWIRCGIALYNHFGEDGVIYWLQFAYNPHYKDTPAELQKVWQRLKKYPGINIGTLFWVAEKHGWQDVIAEPLANTESQRHEDTKEAPTGRNNIAAGASEPANVAPRNRPHETGAPEGATYTGNDEKSNPKNDLCRPSGANHGDGTYQGAPLRSAPAAMICHPSGVQGVTRDPVFKASDGQQAKTLMADGLSEKTGFRLGGRNDKGSGPGVSGAGSDVQVKELDSGRTTPPNRKRLCEDPGRRNDNGAGPDVSGSGSGARETAAPGLCASVPLYENPPSNSCKSVSFVDDPGNPNRSAVPLTISDYPELLELFGRPQNVFLDRGKLPEELELYLGIVNRVTDAQDGAILTAFLPVAAANIGNRVYMSNAGTRHYCNIWAAIIGPSTVSRKTTVINQAMKTLKPFKDSLIDLPAKERNEQDIELSRVTQARLYNLLAINPNRLVLQMELSAWMQEMNKAYNAGMKQEITDMFDGKDRSIAKMEIDEYIRRPAFSIVGATTEDWFFRELREVADQRGGFLQRFVICIIQNIDVDSLRLEAIDSSEADRLLEAWEEPFAVFRALPDSHRLLASDEALEFRNAIYADLMKRVAINANDPQAAYCARIFDNYFWRFCILIFLLKRWQDLKEAMDNDRVQTWFRREKVDVQTAKEAWYLCEYYFQNTQPFLKSLSENNKLDNERRLVKILQKAPDQSMAHSRLLCKSLLTAREFRGCIESLIERQAIIAHEIDSGYKNRVSLVYTLNPALNHLDIN